LIANLLLKSVLITPKRIGILIFCGPFEIFSDLVVYLEWIADFHIPPSVFVFSQGSFFLTCKFGIVLFIKVDADPVPFFSYQFRLLLAPLRRRFGPPNPIFISWLGLKDFLKFAPVNVPFLFQVG